MFGTGWEDRLTVLALIVRYTARPKFVSRIAIRVLVFLGWVSRAVCATNMSAFAACFVTGEEKSLAFMASSSDTLTGLLVNQILATGLARSGKNNLLLLECVGVIGDDGGVLLVSLDDGGSLLTAGDDLGLGALGRVSGALGATGVLAVGTFLGGCKGSIASVAGSSNAHADGLIHAKNRVVGRSSLQLGKLDVEAVTLTQFLGTLLKKLVAGELRDAFHALILGESLSGLGGLGGLGCGDRFGLGACLSLGSRGAFARNHGRQALGGGRRTLSLENSLDAGQNSGNTLLLLLFLGHGGPSGCRRAHGGGWVGCWISGVTFS